MQVIMFDRQSIFIHGMKVGLQQRIPEINIHSTCQAEQLWQLLTAHPQALLMLDGDLNSEFCCWLLQEKQQRFPHAKVLLVVSDDNKAGCNGRWRGTCAPLPSVRIAPICLPRSLIASC